MRSLEAQLDRTAQHLCAGVALPSGQQFPQPSRRRLDVVVDEHDERSVAGLDPGVASGVEARDAGAFHVPDAGLGRDGTRVGGRTVVHDDHLKRSGIEVLRHERGERDTQIARPAPGWAR